MSSAETITNLSFDFIICGGGAAGLVLASRLTENPAFKVLVIEAGSDRRNDPIVSTPGAFLQLYGRPEYDWDFKSTPQQETNGRVHAWPRGKGLGGSGMINFMLYSHCSKGDIDNWRELGNEGWGWDDLLPYFQKVEHFHLPNGEAREILSTEYLQPEIRGTEGLVQTSFPSDSYTWAQKAWAKQSKSMGYPTATDPRTGSSLGLFNQLCSIDPKDSTRSYGATTYLPAAEGRANLTVLTETLVQRVIFETETGGKVRATGVELETQSQTITVKASREVILAAGAVQTPQILELSGVGRKDILQQHGINVVVENNNVGENLQDHPLVVQAFAAKEGVETGEVFRDHPEVAQQLMELYFKTRSGPMAAGPTTTGFLASQTVAPDTSLDALATSGPRLPSLQEELLLKQLHDTKEAEYQVLCMPVGFDPRDPSSISKIFMHTIPGNYAGLAMGLTHPFSRGSVHITSKDIHDAPEIDPRYFSHPLDLELAAHGILYLKKLANTAPLADCFKDSPDGKGKELMSTLSPVETLAEAREAARECMLTEYHPIGTAAMMPKEQGGVVDSELRVYGTENLRVVDASIFPLHVQGNIISLVNAVAEKASDIIKDAYAGTENGMNGAH